MQPVYETMYILRSDLERKQRASNQYQTCSGNKEPNKSKFSKSKRRLAYEINKQRDGIYVQMNYQGPGTLVVPL